MISFIPFQVLELPCDQAVVWVTNRMTTLGLVVMQTFNLRIAQIIRADCPCPIHGTGECDCQVIVMLVYRTGSEPSTLLVHGFGGRTWLSLANPAQRPMDKHLEENIRSSLALSLPVTAKQDG